MVSLGRVVKLSAGVLRCSLPYYTVARNRTTPIKLLSKIRSKQLKWGHQSVLFYSTTAPSNDISVVYKYGRPVLTIPLPSRKEDCLFFLRPMLMNVGDFIEDIQREDAGVATAMVLTLDGQRVSCTSSLDTLLNKDFQLVINDVTYNVHSPRREKVSSEHVMEAEDMKTIVHMMHMAMNIPGHYLLKERDLLEKIDKLKQELSPLETVKAKLALRAESSTIRAMWLGMALLSVQGGALGWLTWWVYSWDVMEPVTYFITYGTSIGVFAYFVLTKQEYIYPNAKDRQFLHYFHKGAKKQHFDVQRYNQLRDELTQVQEDLRRLKKPIQQQLPLEQILAKE
ncbi:calcium uniporter regulatory subunit MCUb, mitochondrial-like [Conger conger]|uniref:calcium uniporter regulatory subunit MCUb, mitochondrial-like n=1 Tax=Conger conger TaxID=82655 RepID=UPI002A5AF783|nr:calcium uniporter regulatory subunit MCUb, mitochondrial-like [Conger conger]